MDALSIFQIVSRKNEIVKPVSKIFENYFNIFEERILGELAIFAVCDINFLLRKDDNGKIHKMGCGNLER